MHSKFFFLTIVLTLSFFCTHASLLDSLKSRNLYVCAPEGHYCKGLSNLICCPFMTCQDTNDGNGVCQGTQCKGVGSDCDAGNNLCCPTLRCKLDSASGSSKCARLFEE